MILKTALIALIALALLVSLTLRPWRMLLSKPHSTELLSRMRAASLCLSFGTS